MIWLWMTLLTAVCAVALAPAFFGRVDGGDGELAEYFAQIDAVEADASLDADARLSARTALERRVLERREASAAPSPVAGALSIAALGLVAFGLYAVTGTPTPPAPAPALAQMDDGMGDLIARLEQRLATDRADDPVGWVLYARTLRSVGRDADARRAFDRAAELSNEPEPIIAERDGLGGPSREDVEAARSLSEAERGAMIQGMVDGLSARLEDEPGTPAEWTRLIRARLVLGQRQEARLEVARLRERFASEPEVAAQVLSDAGWSDE